MTLLHGGLNVWGQFVAVHPAETGDPVSGVVNAAVVTILAGVLAEVYGVRTLARKPGPNTVVGT